MILNKETMAGVPTLLVKEGRPAVTYMITTGEQDADGDIVIPDGIDFEPWIKKGCPVLVKHGKAGWPHPIGHSIGSDGKPLLIKEANGWSATCVFDVDDPVSALVLNLVAKGAMPMSSIGFWVDEGNRKPNGKGKTIEKASCHEWSITDNGANPSAIQKTPLTSYAKEIVGLLGSQAADIQMIFSESDQDSAIIQSLNKISGLIGESAAALATFVAKLGKRPH